MIPFEFQKGNKVSGCEDAPPIANEAYAVVCDGLGGAGSTKHTVLEENAESLSERTSAYLGSRIVSDCVSSYYSRHMSEFATMLSVPDRGDRIKDHLEALKGEIEAAFEEHMEKWKIEPSQGKTIKNFPTTLASAMYFQQEDKLTVLAVWAGDSRVYVFSPQKGLQLLSLDDAKNAENEMNSTSEMTNCISAGNEFRLNYAVYEMSGPGIVFCCSDGCFDYIKSPLHLEWVILHAMLECMPGGTDKELGTVFAESIRDNVYRSIGDDTTMAGIIVGIDSDVDMKALYKERMEHFGTQATEMNKALEELKGYQNERDASQKICRLSEGKIAGLVHDEFCTSIKEQFDGTKPQSRLICAAWELTYMQKKEEIEQMLGAECEAEMQKVYDRAEQIRDACRDMLIRDYIKGQRQKEVAKLKGHGRTGPAFSNLAAARTIIMACIEVYKHPEFSKVVQVELVPEEQRGIFAQSQVGRLEKIFNMLNVSDPLFEDLWGQAYFSTGFFEKEREDYSRSSEFEEFFKQALKNPRKCSGVCELTIKKIIEYHRQREKVKEIKEKYEKEIDSRLTAVAEECWTAYQEDILKSFMSEDETTLQLRFKNTDFPMERLMAYVNAQKTLLQIDDKIQGAQSRVEEIWTQYKDEYQLFKKIEEKGVC